MSKEFPAMVAEELNPASGFHLEDYAPEWFEKVIYIRAEDLETSIKGDAKMNWAVQLSKLSDSFTHEVAEGCSRCTPSSAVFHITFDASGNVTGAETDGSFYTLVTGQSAQDPAIATELTIAPQKNRNQFKDTKEHKDQLALCDVLIKKLDPDGVKKKQQREVLLALGTPMFSGLKFDRPK
jgi:hypothetical protein